MKRMLLKIVEISLPSLSLSLFLSLTHVALLRFRNVVSLLGKEWREIASNNHSRCLCMHDYNILLTWNFILFPSNECCRWCWRIRRYYSLIMCTLCMYVCVRTSVGTKYHRNHYSLEKDDEISHTILQKAQRESVLSNSFSLKSPIWFHLREREVRGKARDI